MSRGEYTRRLLLAGAVAVVAALLVRGLPQLAGMGLVLFTGILMAVVVHGLAAWTSNRTPVPRKAAAVLTIALVLSILGLTIWWSGPRFANQFGQLAERIPAIVADIGAAIEETEWGATLLRRLEGALETDQLDARQTLGGMTSVFTTITGALTGVLIVVFVTLFLAYDPYLYRDAVLDLVPEGERREHARTTLHELARALRLWMKARLVSMGIVGAMTGLALVIAGIPMALALGAIAGILAFVPFIGPLLSAIPAILIGFGESPRTAILVAGIYAGVQLVESYMIDPLVEKRMVSLPPAFVIAAQVVMGTLFGLLGVFLATPFAIVGVVLVQQLYLRNQLGQDPEPLGT